MIGYEQKPVHRALEPGELEAKPVDAVRFDAVTRKRSPVKSVLISLGVAYYAGFDNVRHELRLALAGNIIHKQVLPPGMELPYCD